MLGRFALRLAGHTAETLAQQVGKVPPNAVHGEQVEVVDVQVTALVGSSHALGVEPLQPVLAGDVAGDVVVQPLKAEGHVGVLRDLPIGLFQVGVDGLGLARTLQLAQDAVLLPVQDVGPCCSPVGGRDQHFLHQILNGLDGRLGHVRGGCDDQHASCESLGFRPVQLAGGPPRLLDGASDASRVERLGGTVPFDDG